MENEGKQFKITIVFTVEYEAWESENKWNYTVTNFIYGWFQIM